MALALLDWDCLWKMIIRASAVTPRVSNTTATRIDDTAALFIAHLVSSVSLGTKGFVK
jgi:hypothetical protein